MVILERQNKKENTRIYNKTLKKLRSKINNTIPINHVGSTAIPNMYGKNIIDILIGAKDLEEIEKLSKIIIDLGYFPGNNSKGAYRFFASTKEETKSGDIHIHLALINTDRYKDFLILKEYLLNNKEEVRNYSNLKKELIKDGYSLREDYKKIKSEYVSKLLERAKNNKENISIRLLKDIDSDYKLLEKWYKQEEIYFAFEQRKLTFTEIKKKYYPRTLNNTKIPVYMIEYNNKPVGIIQYKLVEQEDKNLYNLDGNNIYEMDIFIGELNLHNKGIGSKAINMLAEFLFNEKKANLLVMAPLKNNVNAINCYKKCGFVVKSHFKTKDTVGVIQEYTLMIKENR